MSIEWKRKTDRDLLSHAILCWRAADTQSLSTTMHCSEEEGKISTDPSDPSAAMPHGCAVNT